MTNNQEIFDSIYFEARPYNGIRLDVGTLRKLGLEPLHRLEIAGREILLSTSYYVESRNASAHVAYVKTSRGFLARTFFLSRSQAIGRLLVAYEYSENMGKETVTHNSKGFGEQSLILPFEIQRVMAYESSNALKISDSERVFYGTVNDSKDPGVYAREVEPSPTRLSGNFYSKAPNLKVAPEQLHFVDEAERPDFRSLVASWKLDSSLYGPLEVLAFRSINKEFTYFFNVNEKKQVWLPGVESGSEVTSCGVRKKWIDAGNLATPLFEYQFDRFDQTGGYGNPEIRRGNYVDMDRNYLSKIALLNEVRSFLERR